MVCNGGAKTCNQLMHNYESNEKWRVENFDRNKPGETKTNKP